MVDLCVWGHWKAECPVKSSAKSGFGSVHSKPVTLAASVRKIGSPCVISSYEKIESGANCSLERSRFSAFVSDGYVSLVRSGIKVPVKILRDTGAFDSFIVSSALSFSQGSDMGDYILMRGMGLTVLPVPLHKLELDCGLVKGEVTMGVRPALPIRGIHIILGNGLAGSRVWADVPPAPIVTPSPSVAAPDESVLGFPSVFTVCAVTLCAVGNKNLTLSTVV